MLHGATNGAPVNIHNIGAEVGCVISAAEYTKPKEI